MKEYRKINTNNLSLLEYSIAAGASIRPEY